MACALGGSVSEIAARLKQQADLWRRGPCETHREDAKQECHKPAAKCDPEAMRREPVMTETQVQAREEAVRVTLKRDMILTISNNHVRIAGIFFSVFL
jgi:hypothetical protein